MANPPKPRPIRIEKITFIACPSGVPRDLVCMKRAGAIRLIRNNIEIGRWVGEASNLIEYYRDENTKQNVNQKPERKGFFSRERKPGNDTK